MRVEVDADKCVAAGQCVLLAPTVFDQDDDGIAIVLNADPASHESAAVEESVRLCPATAISYTPESS